MIIYRITNKINQKVYIGQTTKSLNTRFNEHIRSSKKFVINKAIQKYSKDNFFIEEIDGANSQTELNYKETLHIHLNNSLAPNGYNLKLGGNGGKMHESTKIKVSNIHKGKVLSETTKLKLKNANIGKKLNKEHKRKIGLAHLGLRRPVTTGNNISLSLRKDKRQILCKNNSKIYQSAAEAGKDLNLDKCCISKVLRKTRKHYKGYIFIYIN